MVFLLALSLVSFQSVERLRDVKAVYVDSLGTSEEAQLIREKLINALLETKKLQITERREDADAILSGKASMGKVEGGTLYRYDVGYSATVALRLVSPSKRVIWTINTESKGRGSASTTVSERAIKELLKAIEKDLKAKD